MKCIDIKENLDALLDNEIEISNKQEIENHLESCISCEAEFNNLQAIRKSLKENLKISAPAFLDEKVLSEFQEFYNEKRPANIEKETKPEKIGWFGIPRFAFAAALVLFALATISAFQLGKMSAIEVSIVMPQVQESKTSISDEFAENVEKSTPAKIVEVPVIQEKIVKVPVIKEKVIIKTIYVNRNKENEIRSTVPAKNDFALKNSVEDNGYLTQTNLKGFQPVSEFKLKISKKEKENE